MARRAGGDDRVGALDQHAQCQNAAVAEQLVARVMGDFRLDGADLTALRSREARLLLKVLAVAGGASVSADSLAETLWIDDLPGDRPGISLFW